MLILRRNADGTVSHNENIILHLKEGWSISDGVRDMIKTIQHNLNDKRNSKASQKNLALPQISLILISSLRFNI